VQTGWRLGANGWERQGEQAAGTRPLMQGQGSCNTPDRALGEANIHQGGDFVHAAKASRPLRLAAVIAAAAAGQAGRSRGKRRFQNNCLTGCGGLRGQAAAGPAEPFSTI